MKHTKNLFIILLLLVFSFLYYTSFIKADDTITSRLEGKILLQVEENGEAWYVSPTTKKRHYMGRPADAFSLMKYLGIGITNEDIKKIKINTQSLNGIDTDSDGLPDLLEDAINTDKTKQDTDGDGYNDLAELQAGYNPGNNSALNYDNDFTKKQAGRILIQAEQNGEAWYVNPYNNERYFLGRPSDAFNIMRQTGLGITNTDLEKIEKYGEQANTASLNTQAVSSSKNKYTDSENDFSITYPNTWKIEEVYGENKAITIRNYEDDIFKERKAMMVVSFINSKEIIELKKFIGTNKDGATKEKSTIKQINNFDALEEVFYYKEIDMKDYNVYLKLSDKQMIIFNLSSAGSHTTHKDIFDEIINSLEIF